MINENKSSYYPEIYPYKKGVYSPYNTLPNIKKQTIMKTNPITLILILCYFNLSAQKSTTKNDSISIEIKKKYKLINEKQKNYDLVSKLINNLNKEEHSELITKNEETNNNLRTEILLLKEEVLNLREKQDININNLIGNNTHPNLSKTASEVRKKYNQFLLNKESKELFKNTKITYEATIFNTNFSIPIARFNFIKDDDSKFGNIQMFNSIGAGFGISYGKMTDYRNEIGELENSEFNNSISFHLGFLFSAGTENDNVFAPTFNIGLMDFQLGYGVELGKIDDNQQRSFLTVGYAIPLYKLKKGKYKFYKKGKIINEIRFDQ